MTPTIALAIVSTILAGISAWLWWRLRRLESHMDRIAMLATVTATNLTSLLASLAAAHVVATRDDTEQDRTVN